MSDILWAPWRMPYLRGEDKDTSRANGCVLCAKVSANNDAAEHVVARSEHVFVILNKYPYNNGHLLIVPYAHLPSVENLPVETLTDLMLTLNRALAALRRVYHPQAFNVGANIGTAAGAGIAEHFHLHVIPRWEADTSFMTIVAGTRTIPELLDDTYRRLCERWEE
jgi:ATP adenylyltransferase